MTVDILIMNQKQLYSLENNAFKYKFLVNQYFEKK